VAFSRVRWSAAARIPARASFAAVLAWVAAVCAASTSGAAAAAAVFAVASSRSASATRVTTPGSAYAAAAAWREGRYFEYLESRVDVVINDADATLNFLLGPGNRARFDARYPRWSPGSLVCGPRLQTPAR